MDYDYPEARLHVNQFLNSKMSEQSREDAKQIIVYLCEQRANDQSGGWVRARDLYNFFVRTGEIVHPTQFFRILDKLTESGVVQKETRIKKIGSPGGKAPIFYRSPYHYSISWFAQSNSNNKTLHKIARRYRELSIAKILLKEHGVPDPDTAIAERYSQVYGLHMILDDEEEPDKL